MTSVSWPFFSIRRHSHKSKNICAFHFFQNSRLYLFKYSYAYYHKNSNSSNLVTDIEEGYSVVYLKRMVYFSTFISTVSNSRMDHDLISWCVMYE